MAYELRPATEADARYVAEHLREDDLRELTAAGMDPLDALLFSFYGSDECITCLVEGKPALIFGVGAPLLSDRASVWALGTDRCRRIPREMVRDGRLMVKALLSRFPVLENYCAARYKRSLRWLRLLGFTIGEPEVYGPRGALFCKISIQRGEV